MARPSNKLSQLEATAYHEAGHAVAAFFFGFHIKSATVLAADDYLGRVDSRPKGKLDFGSNTPAMRIKAEKFIIVTLAGDIAQRRFNPRSSRTWQTTSDRALAADLALTVCGSGESATAYLAWLSIRARDIIHGRWDTVEKVARLLLDRKTVTGQELYAAIIPSRGN